MGRTIWEGEGWTEGRMVYIEEGGISHEVVGGQALAGSTMYIQPDTPMGLSVVTANKIPDSIFAHIGAMVMVSRMIGGHSTFLRP